MTGSGVVKEVPCPAVGLVSKALLQDFSILRGQRSFLPEPPGLRLVERRLSPEPGDDKARPPALPVRIPRRGGGFAAAERHPHGPAPPRDDQTAEKHANPPLRFGAAPHSLHTTA